MIVLLIIVIIIGFGVWLLWKPGNLLISLQKNGYAEISVDGIYSDDNSEIDINLDFKTTEAGRLFIWSTKPDSDYPRCFLDVRITIDGKLRGEITLVNADSQFVYSIISDISVNDGLWHSMSLKINNATMTLHVDNESKSKIINSICVINNNVAYIGGAEDIRGPYMLNGCVKNIRFGSIIPTAVKLYRSTEAIAEGVEINSQCP